LAAPEPDDGAPGGRRSPGDLLHEGGQHLDIPAPGLRGDAGDEPGDIRAGLLHAFTRFAAAFMAFLSSRTFVSASGETMSATLRCAPSSPYGADASRHPAPVNPYCLPSSARKIFAFCSPNPGSVLNRF